MAEAAAAQAQQQHRQVLALGAERAVALDDLHLAAVHQAGAAAGHPDLADDLRDLGTSLNGGEDLGVEPIDLQTKLVDVGDGFCLDRHGCLRILVVWLIWSHPYLGLTQETSPGSGSGPRGSAKQLDHGHRRPVPVKKSSMLIEHEIECATKGRVGAK